MAQGLPPPQPWLQRSVASPDWCIVTPSHRPHFALSLELLDAIFHAALDTVPIYVVLSHPEEASEWSRCMDLAQQDNRGWKIPEHTTIDLENLSNSTTDYLAARMRNMGLPRRCAVGVSWKNNQRQWGHLKKFLAIRHVARRGCNTAWVMDSESRPLRRFHFAELFSQSHILLVRNVSDSSQTGLQHPSRYTRADPECIKLAALVHHMPVSSQLAFWGLQENDFWLYDTRVFAEFVQHATDSGSRSFIDALMKSKSISEQLLWYTFLFARQQIMLQGDTVQVETSISRLQARSTSQQADGAGYTFAAATPAALRPCGVDLDDTQISIWSHKKVRRNPRPLNCTCLGERLLALGQGGLRGEYLFPIKWTPAQATSQLKLGSQECIRSLRTHVPWCMSTLCDTPFRGERSMREFGRRVLWGRIEEDAGRDKRDLGLQLSQNDLRTLLHMQLAATV